MIDVGKMISIIRQERKMSQAQLAKKIGTTKQAVSNYECGKRSPDYITLEAIADVLNVPMSMLITKQEQEIALSNIYKTYENIIPASDLPLKRIPILGETAAGEPIIANREYDEFVEIPDDGHKYDAALRVTGDSMAPRYQIGDLALIRYQDDLEDGQIAAICLDDLVTLKRVYHIPHGLQLISDNPKYAPLIYMDDEINNARLVGIAVGVLHWE